MKNPDTVGFIHSVETFGALDGPGIRYVLFLQGCLLRCKFCHNPDSWQTGSGNRLTAAQCMKDILRYKNFIISGGVTLSGGEPLLQSQFCEAILDECAARGIHTAIDTSGAVPLVACQSAVEKADLLLLDIKSLDPRLCAELTGRNNSNALETLDLRENLGKDVWIRHVVVPGYTLDYERLDELAGYLSRYHCIKRVDLLPFHKLGEFKWRELGEPYELFDTQPPTDREMNRAKEIFAQKGLKVNR